MAGRVEDVEMAVPVSRHGGSKRKGRTRSSGPSKRARRERADATGTGPAPSLPEPADDLVAALRAWRLAEARQRAIAPFVILHDRTLVAIAASQPRTLDDLRDVPGIGPGKIAAFGEAILALVGSTVERRAGHAS